MKWTIENKILVPFVLLFFITQVILMGTSYRNDYKLIINNQYDNMDKSLLELERSLSYQTQTGESQESHEPNFVKQVLHMMDGAVVIIQEDEVLLNQTRLDDSVFLNVDMQKKARFTHIDTGQYLLGFHTYATLGWTLVAVEEKQELLEGFYESYKYNFLTGIIFLTLSLQFTVFIASNITNPIKKLARFCAGMTNGEKDKRIELKRHDEIGQLGDAFNQMLDELERSVLELTQMKEYNENILNSIEKGIITFDFEGRIISENPFAQAIRSQYASYRHEGQSLINVLKDRLKPNESETTSASGLIEFQSENGTDVQYLDVGVSMMHGESLEKDGYICSFTDMTERMRMESRFQRLERLATAGRLASGVAHEVRNPLTGMKTSVQVLRKRLQDRLEEKNEVIFDRIILEIDRINKLVSDLLGYTRVTVLSSDSIPVRQFVSDMLDLMVVELDEHKVNIHVEIQPENLSVYMDRSQLNQIMLNLIKNAVDACNENQGSIHIIGEIDPSRSDWVLLQIKDNGIGMTGEALKKVYDPFFTTKNEGTGLGLSIVHELVHQNEGEIFIDSVLNRGTTVSLRFKRGGQANE